MSDKFEKFLFGADDHVELVVTVSDRTDVKGYGFAFDGIPVLMSRGKGKFNAQRGETNRLEWVMLGEPNGSMKVTVTQDGETLEERAQSTIPNNVIKGFDALEITPR